MKAERTRSNNSSCVAKLGLLWSQWFPSFCALESQVTPWRAQHLGPAILRSRPYRVHMVLGQYHVVFVGSPAHVLGLIEMTHTHILHTQHLYIYIYVHCRCIHAYDHIPVICHVIWDHCVVKLLVTKSPICGHVDCFRRLHTIHMLESGEMIQHCN